MFPLLSVGGVSTPLNLSHSPLSLAGKIMMPLGAVT
jgi:hypothetical protein